MAEPQPVYDFLPGVPPVMNDAIAEAVNQASEEGVEAATWDAHLDERIRELRENPNFEDEVRASFAEAGVNLVSPTVMSTDPRLSFQQGVFRDLARWEARFELLDWMHKVTHPSDVHDVVAEGDIGILLNTQNLGSFTDGEGRMAEVLYNAGVRSTQLTYNKHNSIGAGCTEPSRAGLSNHGRDVVQRLNEVGAIIDLSHCSKETTLDTIELSQTPVAFTHTHCGALVNNARAKSDEEIKALAENDGYMGVLVYPTLYDDPSFDTFFDHFEHARSILGIDRLGISTDWGMTTSDVPESLRPGLLSFWRDATDMTGDSDEYDALTMAMFEDRFGSFEKYGDRPVIRDEFEKRGYSQREIEKVFGENFVTFWERVVD